MSTSNWPSSSPESISLGLAAWLLLLFGGCGSVPSGGRAGSVAPWGPVRHGLRTRVVLVKTDFKRGEKIAVTMQVRNVSTGPIAIPRQMGMFYANTHISFEGEPDTGLIGRSTFSLSSADFIILKPDEMYSFPHNPRFMELQVHAERAGRYTVWSTPRFYGPMQTPGGDRVAGMDVWTGLLESNRASFTVTDRRSGRSTEVEDPLAPPRAFDHVGLVMKAREAAVDMYIKDKAWVALTKPQMEFVLRQHGFAGPFRYGPVYEEWWGKSYDEALFFNRQIDDLWILFKNGKVAQVGTIYIE